MKLTQDSELQTQTLEGPNLEAVQSTDSRLHTVESRNERLVQASFIWPALLIVLALSIFPLIISLYLSLSDFELVKGGFDVRFIGFENYRVLLFGSEQTHFLGSLKPPSLLGWLVLAAVAGLLLWWLVSEVRGHKVSIGGFILRLLVALFAGGLLLLVVQAFAPEARPGTLIVTLVYVFFGISFQYLLGLSLAYLATQRLAGRRFFRVIFLLPMMITPVGVAYMFEMLTDTQKGPFHPVFTFLGDPNFTWVNNAWGARTAVMISDIWQWTPFMFIVLLAALEGQDVETHEAALVDGANRWQIFRNITLPGIIPVSTTLLLIRMIEGFKIVDLPNILTNGGPGTATESLTLEAFIDWRTLDLGRSAAVAYLLLFLVTIVGTTYVNLIRRRAVEI
jgi:multiple sugar transport system permease protein